MEELQRSWYDGAISGAYTIYLSPPTRRFLSLHKGFYRYDKKYHKNKYEYDLHEMIKDSYANHTPTKIRCLNERFITRSSLSHFFTTIDQESGSKDRHTAARILQIQGNAKKFLNERIKIQEILIECLENDIAYNKQKLEEALQLELIKPAQFEKYCATNERAGSRSIRMPPRVMTPNGAVELTHENVDELANIKQDIASIDASQSLRFGSTKRTFSDQLEFARVQKEREERFNEPILKAIAEIEGQESLTDQDYAALRNLRFQLLKFWHRGVDTLEHWQEHTPAPVLDQMRIGMITSSGYYYSVVYNLEGKTARGAQKTKRFQVTIPSLLYVAHDEPVKFTPPQFLRTKVEGEPMFSVSAPNGSTPQVALLPLSTILDNWRMMMENPSFDMRLIKNIVDTYSKDKNISVNTAAVAAEIREQWAAKYEDFDDSETADE